MSVKTWDDFDWSAYTEWYRNQYEDIVGNCGIAFVLEEGVDLEASTVHTNAKEIYEAIGRLKPDSVFECGCGPGHHLWNIQKLYLGITVGGCDITQSQLDLGVELFSFTPDFCSKLSVIDFTRESATVELGEWDFVFTQAVTMHLAFDRAAQFLKNVSVLRPRWVMLMENRNYHDYDKLVKESLPDFVQCDWTPRYNDHAILLENMR